MNILNLTDDRKQRYIYAGFILAILLLGIFLFYTYQDFNQRNNELQEQYEELSVELTSIKDKLETLTPSSRESVEQLTYNRIYRLTEPSVVKITVYVEADFGLTPYSEGSGFIFDSKGHIVTNSHVVVGADEIEITFLDGEITKATLVGMDVYSDLAVVKVKVEKQLKPVKLGNSSGLYVGEQVLAIGNPYGLSGTMTEGIVSQVGRSMTAPGGYLIVGVIQTDAAINPGNSGGPLLNVQGEVVGVNTAIRSLTGEFSGVGFAIPSNLVKKVVSSIIERGRYDHPWLGIQGFDVTSDIAETIGLEDPNGFLITNVLEGSPADEAGLKGGEEVEIIDGREIPLGGDVVIGVDGKSIRGLEDVLLYLEFTKSPGEVIFLTVLRNGSQLDVEVTLGERPPPESGE
jgi:S1-C subfamily serine protease